MKKKFITATLVVACFFIGVQDIQAQGGQGTTRLGAGIGFGSEIGSIGIGIRGDYAVTDHILIAPDIMYFFPDKDFGIKFNWFDINLNANYVFGISNPDVTPYALVGFNFALQSVDFPTTDSRRDFDNTEVGFNLGGGADFTSGRVTLFGEIRYALGNDQLVIGGGAKFPLN